MKLEVSFCVLKGDHEDCQDTALAGGRLISEETGSLECESPVWVALGDGVGGNPGGKEASSFVMKKLAETIPEAGEESLQEAVASINEALLAHAAGEEGRERMATTLTGILFSEDSTFVVSAGNTRVYVLSGAFLRQITTDHTTYQWLLSRGMNDAAEACNKSEIISCLGGGDPKYLKRLSVKSVFEKRMPSLILMTTDGVHDTLSMDEMEDILNREDSLTERAEALCRRAKEQGSLDDVSAILIRPVV